MAISTGVVGSYRPHVAFLQFSGFGGVNERPPDSPHGQTVAAVLPAPEVLLDGGTLIHNLKPTPSFRSTRRVH